MSVCDEKKQIRREKNQLRRSLSASEKQAFDRAVLDRIAAECAPDKYPVIAAYAADSSEPDLSPLLQSLMNQGKTLILPRFKSPEEYDMVRLKTWALVPGKWGIPEPPADAENASAEELAGALWLIPGVAFDSRCFRLGRGKGVYDRLLAHGAARTVGVFYEVQRCAAVPVEDHDRKLDMIVTESAVYRS